MPSTLTRQRTFMVLQWGGPAPLLVTILLISSFFHAVVCQYQKFYFENKYLVKPKNYTDGTVFKIPVIEGEIVTIQCFVRANRDAKYTIDWDYEFFNATYSGTSIVGEVGAEHAVSNLTVFIDKPADIDQKEVACMKETGKTIALEFQVYVHDSNVPCKPCDGTKEIKLRRWGNKKTENEDLRKTFEETLIKKLIEKLNFAEDEVYPVSNGADICGCKKEDSTITPSPDPTTKTEEPTDSALTIILPISLTIIGAIIVLIVVVVISPTVRNYICNYWISTKNWLDSNCMKKYNRTNEDLEENEMKSEEGGGKLIVSKQ